MNSKAVNFLKRQKAVQHQLYYYLPVNVELCQKKTSIFKTYVASEDSLTWLMGGTIVKDGAFFHMILNLYQYLSPYEVCVEMVTFNLISDT